MKTTNSIKLSMFYPPVSFQKCLLFIGLVLSSVLLHAQDTSLVFSPTRFFEMVYRFHPQVRQSAIAVELANSDLLKARGAFDPKLASDYRSKNYQDAAYYDLLQVGLKVPTWYAADLFAGFENNAGDYLNPEQVVPETGLLKAGISLPVLQGLLIDERRATVKQARIMQEASQMEQLKILNDLFLKAGSTYWKWQQSYREYLVYSEAVEIASEILEAATLSYRYGDRAGIDTLEAMIQYQDWLQAQSESYLKYIRNGLEVQNFLWDEERRPLNFERDMFPDLRESALHVWQNEGSVPLNRAENNPEFRLIDYKMNALQVERLWSKEQFKPQLNLKFYALNEPVVPESFVPRGEQIGFDFEFPLFLRKARGEVERLNLELESLQWYQNEQGLKLRNRLANLQMENEQLAAMIELQRQQVDNQQALLEAERTKFIQGESSIFLINQREVQLVKAKLTLYRFENRAQNNLLEQWHASGDLNQKMLEKLKLTP